MAASIRVPSASAANKDKNDQELSGIPPGVQEAADSGEDNERSGPVDWPELVMRIQRGDESGMEDLYHLFARGIRYYLCRQLGHQELDDKVHDTFVIVVQAIQRGDVREP